MEKNNFRQGDVMKKITTVMIAMLLLTLSVLAAHADQEGNARWCNIDSHGCYLNEEGGVKSYMYFWTVESCKYFMGNDNLCKNVVPRYYSADDRHPLEKAPEPIVYQQPVVKTITEWYTLPVTIIQMLSGEQLFQLIFPNGAAEFNGVMIVTDLDVLQEDGNQPLVSLETAGSGEELMIPVYIPKEGFTQDNFYSNFSDFHPMTAELSDSGKAALLGDGAESKNSFLIPYETDSEMNSYLNDALKENFQLAGYVSSSGVGVSPQPDRHMEAKHVDSGHEESGGSDSGSETKNNQTGGSLSVQFSNNEFDKSSESINLPGGASSNTDDKSSSGTYQSAGFNQSMYGGVLTISSNAVFEVEHSNSQGTAENKLDNGNGGAVFIFSNSGNAGEGVIRNNPFGSDASVAIVDNNGNPINGPYMFANYIAANGTTDNEVFDGRFTGGAIYFNNSGSEVKSVTFVDNNGNPINGSSSASGNGNMSGGEITAGNGEITAGGGITGQFIGNDIGGLYTYPSKDFEEIFRELAKEEELRELMEDMERIKLKELGRDKAFIELVESMKTLMEHMELMKDMERSLNSTERPIVRP